MELAGDLRPSSRRKSAAY